MSFEGAKFFQGTVVFMSCLLLVFYLFMRTQRSCGWEVIYVAAVEPCCCELG